MDPRLEAVDKIMAVIDTDDFDDAKRELAFAILAVDENDPTTLNWLAAVCAKRAGDLTPTDEILALWFTPGAIRDHFDGDDSPLGEAVQSATDEQLRAVGEACIGADSLYREFHRLLETHAQDELLPGQQED